MGVRSKGNRMDKYAIFLAYCVLNLSFCAARRQRSLLTEQQRFHFTDSIYNATIVENAISRTYVKSTGNIKMGIYMVDPTWDIRYRIISGDDGTTQERMFRPEAVTVGDFCFIRIRTRSGIQDVINREIKPYYQLTVKAILRKIRPTISAQAQINLYVEDTNDLTPLFLKRVYEVAIPEDTPVQKSIIRLTASDADTGVNGEIYYHFKEKTDTFSIHPTTGVVSVLRPLDHTEKGLFIFNVVAQDRGLGFRKTRAELHINVTEINFHSPQIKVQELPMLYSQVKRGTIYALLYVSDEDDGINGDITDVRLKSEKSHYFTLQKETNLQYKIVVTQSVEEAALLDGASLTIIARDGGTPPKSSTKVLKIQLKNANVYAPKFEHISYRFAIEECVPVETLVGKVSAVDDDEGDNGQIFYTFGDGNKRGLFTLDKDTGIIKVAAELDAESTDKVHIELTATDGANKGQQKSSMVPVEIFITDCNDITPRFNETEVSVTVEENQVSGSYVYQLFASDLDKGNNGKIVYSFVNENEIPFRIDPFKGIVYTSRVLDFESMRRMYKLRIRASDSGKPFRRESEIRMKVRVRDLNDNTPIFEQKDCVGYLSREAPPGTSVTVFSALDFDASDIVSYHIVSGNEDNCFELFSSTGVLKMRCSLQEYPSDIRRLVLTASDGKHQANFVTLNITLVNNNRNSQLANRNALVTCTKTEAAEKYRQLLKLADASNKEEAIVDPRSVAQPLNLHTPVFLHDSDSIYVKEDVPLGTVITRVSAQDEDSGFNGKLQYVIVSGNPNGVFQIGTYSGEVSVYSKLDREFLDHYTLTVKASDMGNLKKVSEMFLEIHILDVNDCAPKFQSSRYVIDDISEDTPVNTTLLIVSATDLDDGLYGEVRYSIVGGQKDFSINPFSGAISISRKLDREKTNEYNLTVMAVDNGSMNQKSSFASVQIKVSDVNDNPPKFVPNKYHINIREDLPVGTVIMIAAAFDPDMHRGGQVRYSILDGANGKFEMNQYTGVIRIASSLDFETQQVYNVTIQAKDRGDPPLFSLGYLSVDVVDVNENHYTPKFKEFIYEGSIKENAEIGSTVLKVTAEDRDGRDQNANPDDYKVTYSFVGGNGLGMFSIDDDGKYPDYYNIQ